MARRLLALILLAGSAGSVMAADGEGAIRPNFLVVLVDDAAFMDFGIYGGEARTPAIDALAARGAMLTNYHTSPLCAPSRAMLLTGLDNHRTGLATIPEVLPKEHEGKPGYTMRLEPGVTTIAARLRDAGYATLMTGKWHLGHEKGELPVDHGFERSFILDASGADNWQQKSYMPYYKTADWFEDGARATLPDDFYSSEFLVNKMIGYLDTAPKDKPFFAYLAFQAVHIPVQAPKEFTDRYAGTFDGGWEKLRADRHARAQKLGLIPADAPLKSAPAGRFRDWEALSAEDRALYAKSMAVNAGMIEAMDHHLARLLAHLEATGQLENTIVIVTSDNGPEPSEPLAQTGFSTWMLFNNYDRRLENLGERGSYAYIGPEWATAAAAPFTLFKFYASEGGMRVPFVMAGPGVAAGTRTDALGFVTDIAPTLLDYAGSGEQAAGMTGRSLRPVVSAVPGIAYGPQDAVGMEVSGHAALYKGRWKLVRNMPPWGDGEWHLFDMETDPGETTDLSLSLPDIVAQMHRDYAAYKAENGVLDLPEGYDIHRQIARNALLKQLNYYGWQLALALAAIAGAGWFAGRAIFRRRRR